MNDQERLLTIFLRLQFGTPLGKKQLAQEFEVSEKTIQRDFSLLRDILSSHPDFSGDLLYSRKTNKYSLSSKSVVTKKDILIISKILLENRALNRAEIDSLQKKLLVLVPYDDQKEIKQIIGSENLNYAPLTDRQDRIEKVWELSEAILHEQVIDIMYQNPYSESSKRQAVFPVSLYYDSHYFYLVVYQLKHETYITLRVDRIQSWDPSNIEKPSISYRDKFRDGDIRNERVDAFIGKKISVEIEYLYDPTIVMDQFPNAKIVGKNEGWTRFKFESQYTPGLKRWLLSQGEAVKILSPQSLVDDIRRTMKEILDYYQ
ncbi:helix-turn-helix transcriptional regulator [Streptococcus gordonii]|uniref:helix-turn-helix transcriptional regulator n=1 Tax=Streptococcus gordonii TaxID=1302 RepID=UPI0022845FEF|nr:WYL domain-containing protein [Streptococcus gordonii]MCY7133333.1 WYL domain-containing protein [Streptococcus gordonii]